jgi:hypothetical protein
MNEGYEMFSGMRDAMDTRREKEANTAYERAMSSQITPQQRADAEDKAQRTAAFQKQSESDLAGRLASGATGGISQKYGIGIPTYDTGNPSKETLQSAAQMNTTERAAPGISQTVRILRIAQLASHLTCNQYLLEY